MKLKEVMTSMDYEKLYKAYYLQVYSYTISLAKNREIAEEIFGSGETSLKVSGVRNQI